MIKDEKREQELLQQIVSGNKVAMKNFYDIYSGYLTAVCSRYVPNKEDVKDILQESFINIFKSINKFKYRGKGSLKASLKLEVDAVSESAIAMIEKAGGKVTLVKKEKQAA